MLIKIEWIRSREYTEYDNSNVFFSNSKDEKVFDQNYDIPGNKLYLFRLYWHKFKTLNYFTKLKYYYYNTYYYKFSCYNNIPYNNNNTLCNALYNKIPYNNNNISLLLS